MTKTRELRFLVYEPPDPGTDQSESKRDFENFVGPGPVRDLEILQLRIDPGPAGSDTWIPD